MCTKTATRTHETVGNLPIMGIYAPIDPSDMAGYVYSGVDPAHIGGVFSPSGSIWRDAFVAGLFSETKSKLKTLPRLKGIKGKLAASKVRAAGGRAKVTKIKEAVGTGANRQAIKASAGKIKAAKAARSLLRWARREGVAVGQGGDEYIGEWDTHGHELMLFSERDYTDVRKRAQALAAASGIYFGLLPGLADGGTLVYFSPNPGVTPSITIAQDTLGIMGVYAHTVGCVEHIEKNGEGSVSGIFQRKPDTLRKRIDTLYGKIDKLKAAMDAQGESYGEEEDYMEEVEIGSLKDRFAAVGDWARGRGKERRSRRSRRIRQRRAMRGELPVPMAATRPKPPKRPPVRPRRPRPAPRSPEPMAYRPEPQLKIPAPTERLSSYDAARLGVQSYAPRKNASPMDYDYDPYLHSGRGSISNQPFDLSAAMRGYRF